MGEEMREIKFKVWDKKNKKWHIQYPNCGSFFSIWKDGTISRDSEDDDYILVEYTGLKDKHGKEIYEGDILKDKWNNMGIVKWIEPGFEWFEIKTRKLPCACFWESCEVIGNIYGNPELLGK